jgi:hypothetical protein
MPTRLQKITLAVLPFAGLLWTAPLIFAHDSGEYGRGHSELNEEHQEGHEALNAEYRAFNSQHRTLHQDLNAQHEDYHDGNRYHNWADDRLSESLASQETSRSVFVRPLTVETEYEASDYCWNPTCRF